jgi:hypothetical protein
MQQKPPGFFFMSSEMVSEQPNRAAPSLID